MTSEDIIRMAREAGDCLTDKRGREDFIFDSYGIERFANLVAAAEREACATVCENYPDPIYVWTDVKAKFADAIRARGES